MKYFSESLNKVFDTVEALNKAEAELEAQNQEKKRKAEERAARAKEVEEAYAVYKKTLAEFCKDYGAYHTTYTPTDFKYGSLIDALCDLF